MKYSKGSQGRVFVIRLEDGEVIHQKIEELADRENISSGYLIALGGAGTGSKLVVGPRDGEERPVVPQEALLEGVHEVSGTGTLFPDEEGRPRLHMHLSCGRGEESTTGCIRRGVKTWQVMEVILVEVLGTSARREYDPESEFTLLEP